MLRGTFTFVFLCVTALMTHAQTVTFNAIADARVIAGNFAGSNYGSDVLSTFVNASNVQNTLVRFDIGSIPSGQVITNARLRLYGTPFGTSSESATTNVFRVTQAWTENQVTWISRTTGSLWSNAGGSFVGTAGIQGTNPYASFTGTQQAGWYEWNVTQLVSQWNDGTYINYGIALSGFNGNVMHFTSREGSSLDPLTTTFVPELVVSYEPVPEPITLLVLVGGMHLLRRKRNSA